MANNDVIEIIVQATDSASEVFNAIGQSSTAMGQSIGQAIASSGTEIGIVQERLIGLRDSAVSTFSEYSNGVSEVQTFLITLAELMPWFSSRLLSPWTLATIEIGLAIKKYGEYMESIREWRGKEAAIDNPFTPQDKKNELILYSQLDESTDTIRKRNLAKQKEAEVPVIGTNNTSYPQYTASSNIEVETRRLEEELQRMQDRLSQMVNGMNEKIIGETGTTFQANSDRMTKEIEKMYVDLGKMADKGIDISGATAKIDEYREVMLTKFTRDQENAQKATKNQANQLVATIANNKGLLADLQRDAAYLAADKESLDIYQKTGDKGLADNLKKERYAAADKTNSDTHRDLNLEEINQQIQHNEMLITLENKTQAEIDTINKKALQDKIDLLNADIKAAGNDKAKVLKYEQEKVGATNKLHELSGRSMSTASNEAMRRIKAQTYDYAGLMVDTFNEIKGSITNHLGKILQGTESFSQGMKGIFSDMIKDIEQMMLKMWVQQAIMGPLQAWFGGVLGGKSNMPEVNTWSNTHGGAAPTFENGGLGLTGIGTGGSWTNIPQKAKGGLGRGLTLVGEEGPELINFDNPGMVYTAGQTKNILGGSNSQQQPKVTVNVINNTKSEVKTSKQATYDSETQTTIVTLWIDAYERNVNGLRDAIPGGAT